MDSTKLKSYQLCPRKFFFEYVLGWRQEEPSHDLVFGSAMHNALEFIYNQKKTKPHLTTEETKELTIDAYTIFLKDYRQVFPEDTDAYVGVKNPTNFMCALVDYLYTYPTEPFKIICTEISGTVPISFEKPREVTFRFDMLCRNQSGVFVMEHKSSKWSTTMWADSFMHNIQVGTYIHALQCLYDDALGVTLNGIFFRPAPRYKKDGELAANSSKGNEFIRLPITINPVAQEYWLNMVNSLWDRIDADMQIMRETSPDAAVMKCFYGSNDCFAFNRRCPYYDFCGAWHNPLAHADKPPMGFKIDFWDPRDEHTKAIDVLAEELKETPDAP